MSDDHAQAVRDISPGAHHAAAASKKPVKLRRWTNAGRCGTPRPTTAIGARHSTDPDAARVPSNDAGDQPRTKKVRRAPPTGSPGRSSIDPPLTPPISKGDVVPASCTPTAPRTASTWCDGPGSGSARNADRLTTALRVVPPPSISGSHLLRREALAAMPFSGDIASDGSCVFVQLAARPTPGVVRTSCSSGTSMSPSVCVRGRYRRDSTSATSDKLAPLRARGLTIVPPIDAYLTRSSRSPSTSSLRMMRSRE